MKKVKLLFLLITSMLIISCENLDTKDESSTVDSTLTETIEVSVDTLNSDTLITE
jgi:hypothetical protein